MIILAALIAVALTVGSLWVLETRELTPMARLLLALVPIPSCLLPFVVAYRGAAGGCGAVASRIGSLVFISSLLAGASAAVCAWALRHLAPTPAVKLALALIPTPFYLGLIWSMVDAVRASDELWQRIQLEAMAFGLPASALAFVTIGYLRMAGFLGGMDFLEAVVILILAYLLGLLIASRRYR